MQGQSWVREGELDMHDTFAVFRAEGIDFKLLSLMVQVVKRVWEGKRELACIICFHITLAFSTRSKDAQNSTALILIWVLQDLGVNLTEDELQDMITDASCSRGQSVSEEDYKYILKHSGWM